MGDQCNKVTLAVDLAVKISKELFSYTSVLKSAVFTYIKAISVKWGNSSDPSQFLTKQRVPISPRIHQSKGHEIAKAVSG